MNAPLLWYEHNIVYISKIHHNNLNEKHNPQIFDHTQPHHIQKKNISFNSTRLSFDYITKRFVIMLMPSSILNTNLQSILFCLNLWYILLAIAAVLLVHVADQARQTRMNYLNG